MGFNYNANAFTDGLQIIRFFDVTGNAIQCELQHGSGGAIKLVRTGAGTVLGTSGAVLAIGSDAYIEAKIAFHSTAGTATIKVNGATALTLTGINTISSTNAWASAITLGTAISGANNQSCLYDDLYVCDTTGASNNDFLGDCRVDLLLPSSDGTYSQFTPSSAGAHYTLADEVPPNTTDYNDGSTVGHRDSYQMGNLTPLVSQTVYGVQVCAAVTKDDAGSRSAAPFIRSATTDSDGPSTALSTSLTYLLQVAQNNPANSSAWTETSVNAIEAGVKVTA